MVVVEWLVSSGSRAWCRLVGHRWSEGRGAPLQVCTRTACRGRSDAIRMVLPPRRARGGVIPVHYALGAPSPFVLQSWECVINGDGVCVRSGPGHDPDNAPRQAHRRVWICANRTRP